MKNVRNLFPFFDQDDKKYNAFLDTAASSQKPKVVIDKITEVLSSQYANVHRGAYSLSANATKEFEAVRGKTAEFLGAKSEESIIFTKGTTEAFNLVANSLWSYFNEGDTILITLFEHHSNIVPWELLAKKKNLKLEFVNVLADGRLDFEDCVNKIKNLKPKLVSISALANAMGTLLPVKEIAKEAKGIGALVCVDGAQAVLHSKQNLKESQVDFFAFSSHKLYGPTGLGVLYVNQDCYQHMEPYQGGGDMIEEVTIEGSTFANAPHKFEAGTPAIVEVIAFGTALDFVNEIGFEKIKVHETEIFEYAAEKLSELDFVECYGPYFNGYKELQASIITFNVKGVHAHDVATIADSNNVQMRAGHHCAMPLLKHLNLNATARMSIGIYTQKRDVDMLCSALLNVKKIFG